MTNSLNKRPMPQQIIHLRSYVKNTNISLLNAAVHTERERNCILSRWKIVYYTWKGMVLHR